MESTDLAVKIAQRIAAHEDSDVATLNPPIHEVIDVDALEALIDSRPHERTEFTGTVSFDYREYSVTVDHTGAVSVTGAVSAADPAGSNGASDRRVIYKSG